MNADILFISRDSFDFFAQRRHAMLSSQKNEKTAGTAGNCTHSQMTSTVARSGHDPFRKGSWRLLIYMSTPCHCARKVVHFPLIHANGHYYLIQVKNRAWSPSLPFFPSLLRHVFYIVLKKKKKKKKKLQEVKKNI